MKIAHEAVEVSDVLEGLPGQVGQSGTRFIGEECEVGFHGIRRISYLHAHQQIVKQKAFSTAEPTKIMRIFQNGTIIPRKSKGESGLMTGFGQRRNKKARAVMVR